MSHNLVNHPSPLWTRIEDKLFEEALVSFPDGTPGRWQLIALQVPGRSPHEVLEHYKALVHDVEAIESGRVEPPVYVDEESSGDGQRLGGSGLMKGKGEERKKGTPWTEPEHRRFLEGLALYGKGDWRNISRWVVKTKTPTQVASHAQKFFNRQNCLNRESKRKSIHDITEPYD